MKQSLLFLPLCCTLYHYASTGFVQQLTAPLTPAADKAAERSSKGDQGRLPADLPQAKLLFIKYSPVEVPSNRPDNMTRRQYGLLKNHNEVYAAANEQLVKAAANYPFGHRITTQDSSTYYATRGYKYALFHSSFNATTDGTYAGTNGNYATTVKLFVQDLATGNRYQVDTFSETFIYYYKGIVGKLLKQVAKQFPAEK